MVLRMVGEDSGHGLSHQIRSVMLAARQDNSVIVAGCVLVVLESVNLSSYCYRSWLLDFKRKLLPKYCSTK